MNLRRLLAAALLLWPSAVIGACTGQIGDELGPVGDDPAGSCTEEGAVEYCYPGDPAQVGIGECRRGTTTCSAGQWTACSGFGLATDEVCGDGLDNNCDGVVDEGCGCDSGESRPCYTGPAETRNLGICADGTQDCVGGLWSTSCEGQTLPGTEACDGVDNNCNGLVDDGCACVDGTTQPCYTGPNGTEGVGSCHGGQLVCTDGQWPSVCSGEATPAPETCNGADDDCDGQSDEGNPGGGGNCNTGSPGVCASGTLICQNGSLGCQPNTSPSSETCDSLDNDCDGQTDEGNPGGGASCSTGMPGICAAGTLTCQNGSLGCQQNQSPGTESCGNGLDDDCDGVVDEGCCNNIAPAANASISGGGTGTFGAAALNDGVGGAQCSLCSACFCWISNSTTPGGAYIQYDWPSPQTVGSIWIDSTDCGTSCGEGRNVAAGTVQYWNGSSWVTATSFSGKIGDFGVNLPSPVSTTSLRVYDLTTSSCGQASNSIIYEWKVYAGTGCGP